MKHHHCAARAGIFLLLVVLIPALTFATPLLEVQVPDRDTWQRLASGGYLIVEGPRGLDDGVAYVVGYPYDLARLQQSPFVYNVYIEDLESWYASGLDPLEDMGGYPTFSEMEAWLDSLYTAQPGIVSVPEVIGFSYEDRPIRAFKISDNPNQDEDEPEILLDMLIHSNEVVNLMTAQEFSEHLTNNYGSDPRVTDLVNNREIWIVPVLNPDGLVYNEIHNPNGGGMHRKNMSPPDGVDLNRNWPYMWGRDNQGSSPDPYSWNYRGASPASEPETQAYMAFINSHEFEAGINYHSYMNVVNIPWSFAWDPHPERELYMAWGRFMAETLPDDWMVGGNEIFDYPANGILMDWEAAGNPDDSTSANYYMYGFVVEVGSWANGGFWPDSTTGRQLAQMQIEPIMRFCEMAPNPALAWPPVQPVMTVNAEETNPVTVTWMHDDPNGNDAVSYELTEVNNPSSLDGAEHDNTVAWTFGGFIRTTAREYSGEYSYHSSFGNYLNNTMEEEFAIYVEPGMDFTFWTWYDIESHYDYAYVMASIDGEPFRSIAGNITTELNPNGNNMGHGITGSSGGWVQGTFDLESFVGSYVRIRIDYITDYSVIHEGIYIDDIMPIVAFETMTPIASGITEESYTIDYGVVDYPFTTYYIAKATDAYDQTGCWSHPAEVLVTGGGQPNALFAMEGLNTTVGPAGGIITYSASLQTFVPQNFLNVNYWTMVTLPGGSLFGPVSQLTVNIPAFADITVPEMQVAVPGYAPAGTYTFTGHLGYYPTSVLDASFPFEKTAVWASDNEAASEWWASDWPAEFLADAQDEVTVLPSRFELSQARPNPFNPVTSLTLSLPLTAEVSVVLYDVQGREVERLVEGVYSAGMHPLTFDGTNHSSGVYFVKASANNWEAVQKLVLLK